MKRTPAEIDEVLGEIKSAWLQRPELSLPELIFGAMFGVGGQYLGAVAEDSQLLEKLKQIYPRRYWKIIGGFTGEQIGVCRDPLEVLQEEPESTFEEMTEAEFKKYGED